jgi:hypothetical protein
MRRKTFDKLLTSAGLVLAAVLLVAGGLLAWGATFTSTQVHDQLAAQQIFFPPAGSEGLSVKEFPTLQQYGSQQVVNGAQAEAYANDYIAAHIKAIGAGKTYSQLSTESRAKPDDAALKATVDTVFRGETLRGLLLNAYAFGTIGQIAMYASIAAFVAAAAMLVLSLLGFAHLRKVGDDVQLGGTVREPVAV